VKGEGDIGIETFWGGSGENFFRPKTVREKMKDRGGRKILGREGEN